MKKAWNAFTSVLIKLGIVMLIFSLCRVLFYVFNRDFFDSDGLLRAFVGGIRFDLSAVVYINLGYIFLQMLPFPFRQNKGYQKLLKTLFLVTNAIGILFNCIDIEYFKFTLKRSTFDLFTFMGTGGDVGHLIPQFIKDYWYLVVIFTLFIAMLSWLYNKTTQHEHHENSWTKKDYLYSFLVFALAVGLSILGGRGGLQYRPLGLINATLYGKADKMPLILNTPFSIIRSYGADYLEAPQYFATEAEMRPYFSPVKKYESAQKRNDNVVIIVMESFSYEFLHNKGEYGKLAPFMDSLSTASLRFRRSYANGKKSVEGIPSIVNSLPSLMTNPFIFSPYSANKINGLASLLKKEGYHNTFFHGAANGSMGFDAFTQASGYDAYYGKDEYPLEGHDDGIWGIWDEEFFQFFCSKLSEEKEPFFSTVFSLTSHHPYQVPDRYKDQFPKAKDPYEHVIQYADYALKKFFESAKKTDWYAHTLFIITADHTSQSTQPYFRNREGMFRVPLFFFHPSDITPMRSDKVAQHSDIVPSVIDWLGVDQEFISFGKSIFDNKYPYCVQQINNIYQIENKNYHLEFDGERTLALYNLEADSLLMNNLLESTDPKEWKTLENQLKAVIQEYNQRMINNKLSER